MALSFRIFSLLFLCIACRAQVPFAYWKSTASSSSTAPVAGYAYLWSGDAGVMTASGTVSSWTDQASGAVLTPPTGQTGPATTTQNGYTVLSFSDAGILPTDLGNATFTISSPWEMVAVVETGSDIGNGNPYAIETDGGTARGVLVSSSQWELAWNSYTLSGSPSASTWYIVDATFSNTGTSTLNINGSSVLTQAGFIYTQTGFFVGGFGSLYPWSGDIAMIIIYTTPLNSTQQAQNVTNLRAKYGF